MQEGPQAVPCDSIVTFVHQNIGGPSKNIGTTKLTITIKSGSKLVNTDHLRTGLDICICLERQTIAETKVKAIDSGNTATAATLAWYASGCDGEAAA